MCAPKVTVTSAITCRRRPSPSGRAARRCPGRPRWAGPSRPRRRRTGPVPPARWPRRRSPSAAAEPDDPVHDQIGVRGSTPPCGLDNPPTGGSSAATPAACTRSRPASSTASTRAPRRASRSPGVERVCRRCCRPPRAGRRADHSPRRTVPSARGRTPRPVPAAARCIKAPSGTSASRMPSATRISATVHARSIAAPFGAGEAFGDDDGAGDPGVVREWTGAAGPRRARQRERPPSR